MNYIPVLRDSIETSVSMQIFKSKEEASMKHLYDSKLTLFPLLKCKNLNNFNPERLQKMAIKAYPLYDRPRGNNDISSVKYYQKMIKKHLDIQPIWMVYSTKSGYTLLDGAHRIVASYIENKKNIYAYIIRIN